MARGVYSRHFPRRHHPVRPQLSLQLTLTCSNRPASATLPRSPQSAGPPSGFFLWPAISSRKRFAQRKIDHKTATITSTVMTTTQIGVSSMSRSLGEVGCSDKR